MVTKFFKKIDKRNAILFAISAAFVFVLPAVVLAIVNYPASAGLGIGTVKSSHILDRTITSVDINPAGGFSFGSLGINTVASSTQIALFASTTDAALTVRQNNGLASGPLLELFASTTPRLIVTNAGLLGIGTSTPGTHLSVAGGAVIDTTLTAQSLVATSTFRAASSTLTGNTAVGNLHIGGTLRIANTTYTLPTTDGTANQAMVTNGAGVLSFADAANWVRLASTTITAASSSWGVFLPSPRTHLKVYVLVTGISFNTAPSIVFNRDVSSVYSEVGGANMTACALQTGGTGTGQHRNIMEIWNHAGQFKTVLNTGGTPGATAGAATLRGEGHCQWGNANQQITEIWVAGIGANTYNAGSSIVVYGSDN